VRETVPSKENAPLAQLDRATASGAVGQWFESTGARRIKDAESANAALEADHNRITSEEASALLEAARAGEKIATERARDFARAVLELDEIGRLALAVLDGGLFVGSRVVELASAYLAVVEDADGTLQSDAEAGEAAS
jgi:hypothetical protein